MSDEEFSQQVKRMDKLIATRLAEHQPNVGVQVNGDSLSAKVPLARIIAWILGVACTLAFPVYSFFETKLQEKFDQRYMLTTKFAEARTADLRYSELQLKTITEKLDTLQAAVNSLKHQP